MKINHAKILVVFYLYKMYIHTLISYVLLFKQVVILFMVLRVISTKLMIVELSWVQNRLLDTTYH